LLLKKIFLLIPGQFLAIPVKRKKSFFALSASLRSAVFQPLTKKQQNFFSIFALLFWIFATIYTTREILPNPTGLSRFVYEKNE